MDANRREYLFALACESPVLALGLFSLQWLKKLLFWLGWGIHAAFTACVLTAVIWLKFFWVTRARHRKLGSLGVAGRVQDDKSAVDSQKAY